MYALLYDLQIKFKDGCFQTIFGRVMPLEKFCSFSDFFSAHRYSLLFGILLYNTKIQIHFEFGFDPLIFTEVMALGLEKYFDLSVFRTFFSLLTDIHLVFGTLLCHTKIEIHFEFRFDPLSFTEVMALLVRKISRIISFPYFLAHLS
jgi:hypothetical protein